MLSCLWHASLILASLWGPGEFLRPLNSEFGVEIGMQPPVSGGNPAATVVGGNVGAAVGGAQPLPVAVGEPPIVVLPGPFGIGIGKAIGPNGPFEIVGDDYNQIPPRPIAAPLTCPAGGKASPKIVAKAERAQQIQFDVTVFELNRTALPKFKFRWAENQAGQVAFGVLADVDGLSDTLAALREAGLVKTLSQPRLMAVSGRKGMVAVGGQIAVPSLDPNSTVSYKQFGLKLELLPTLQANGKIHLDACYENSWLNRSKDITISGATPTTVPGFDSHCAHVATELEPGKTLAIGGLMRHEISVTLLRIPFLSDLPVCGDWFVYRELSETRQETVILITPHLVKNRGDSSETCEPPIVTPAKTERGNRLNLDDVIALSKSRLSPRIIIRQMELTNANFDLTVDDLIRLAEAGVDDEIISAMQERR